MKTISSHKSESLTTALRMPLEQTGFRFPFSREYVRALLAADAADRTRHVAQVSVAHRESTLTEEQYAELEREMAFGELDAIKEDIAGELLLMVRLAVKLRPAGVQDHVLMVPLVRRILRKIRRLNRDLRRLSEDTAAVIVRLQQRVEALELERASTCAR